MTVVRYRLFREQQPCVSILGELIRIFSNLASRWLAKRETRLVVRSAGQTADRKPRLRSFRRRLLSGYFSDSPASSLFLSLSLSLTHSLAHCSGPAPAVFIDRFTSEFRATELSCWLWKWAINSSVKDDYSRITKYIWLQWNVAEYKVYFANLRIFWIFYI